MGLVCICVTVSESHIQEAFGLTAATGQEGRFGVTCLQLGRLAVVLFLGSSASVTRQASAMTVRPIRNQDDAGVRAIVPGKIGRAHV